MTPIHTAVPPVEAGLPPQGQPLRIDGWELLHWAAEGEFADVYRGRPSRGRAEIPAAYAIKKLKTRWYAAPEVIALFDREARVGREVRHPHLISVLAASTDVCPYYLVSPWLRGCTLKSRLAAGPALDLPRALWIARQAAEALGALERAGWMHGDVKPANLIISPEGHVTLLDLGFAQPAGCGCSAIDRPAMGTYQYIAPELITSRLAADVRSDLYSLGIVLFEMLAGRLPFAGRTLAELAGQHRGSSPPDLRKLVPMLPAGVCRLVHELLAKNPWRRPQHAEEVVERLMALEIATFGQRWLA